MSNKKISVIVPVYNVEKYIEKNIKSLLEQSFSDFEVIYVDDGSNDNCLKILNDYKLKDNRVKVVHTDNHGVSHTRNVGLDLAKGEYITFIDGDDYVDSDYLKYLLSLVEKDNIDMAISLSHHINDDLNQPEKITYEIKNNNEIIDNIYLNRIYMAVWNKIYRRSFIEKNNIRFDENLWYAEGMHFNIQCLACTKKIAVGNKNVYHYISNPNSAMRKGFKIKNEQCALKSLSLQRKILNKNRINTKSLEYHYMMVEYMIYRGIIENDLTKLHEVEMKNSIIEIKKRKYIPLQVDLGFKDKILWLCIGLFPKYMVKRNLKKNR